MFSCLSFTFIASISLLVLLNFLFAILLCPPMWFDSFLFQTPVKHLNLKRERSTQHPFGQARGNQYKNPRDVTGTRRKLAQRVSRVTFGGSESFALSWSLWGMNTEISALILVTSQPYCINYTIPGQPHFGQTQTSFRFRCRVKFPH